MQDSRIQVKMPKQYKELKVSQKSSQKFLEVYRITIEIPKEERFGLISQIRRTGMSQFYNIIDKVMGKLTLESPNP